MTLCLPDFFFFRLNEFKYNQIKQKQAFFLPTKHNQIQFFSCEVFSQAQSKYRAEL